MKLKKILKESNAPGFKDRKFGAPLPTLDSVKKAYEAKQGKEVNERLDRSIIKRMDGLHNQKYMKTFLDSASLLYQEMEEEGFDGQDIYDYLTFKLNNTNL